MNSRHSRIVAVALLAAAGMPAEPPAGKKEQHLLYVANPGIRNYEENGGTGRT